MDTRHYLRAYLAVGLVTLVVLLLLGYSYYSSNRMVNIYAPLVQAIEGIRVETATARLWVQEIHSGKSEHNMDEVSWLLDEADWYAQAILEGGEDSKTEYIPVYDPFLRQQIQELRDKLGSLREITEDRYELDDLSKNIIELEQYYDEIFNALHDQAKEVVEQAQQFINQEIKLHRSAQGVLAIISIFLFSLIGILFHSHHSSLRKHARHLEKEITVRKQTEKALHESEKWFHSLFDSSRDAIMIMESPSWKFTSGNPATVTMFGAKNMEHFITLGPWDLSPEQQPDGRASAEKSKEMIETAMRKGTHFFEWTHQKINGQTFPTTVLLSRVELAEKVFLQATVRDITEHKQAEQTLQASEKQYRLIANSIPVVISYLDAEQRYQFNNTNFEKQFGISSDAVIGHHISDVIGDSTYGVMRPYLEEALNGKQVNYEFEYQHQTGDPSVFSVTNVPHVAPDGGTLGVYIMSIDITVQRQFEQRLQRSQRLEALGQLTGGFAHHFNNLLAIILGYLELFSEQLQDNADTKAKHYLEKIVSNVHRSALLTQQLLAFSRKQVLKATSLDLNTLIMDMKALLQETVGGNIKIENVCADDLWCCLADANQMENSILHLINNARDAMPEGGKLTIETANTRLDDEYAATHAEVVTGQYVMLAVSDTGTGMSEEVLTKVFEPFYTTKEVGKGNGLGLSMAYGFARQSKGHLSIYSKLGKGTTVKLFLPRC